ncbi:DUF7537 family lipoprotein [Haloarcula salinisoli]|uniref:Uncharacterized protein n=1 Tax=Haloarcula salinisoli TaxID=2487746 RepID=A0A8J7YNK2_9EURY|nr:hypothetical protein [Halomicroarcula salinisoli]MBX0287380.1 hypothetical protein [Halomicroarcula salinisoli]MBX0305046.1 hypothetical protein [Halomicroarcula salinisoli]
MRKGIAVLVVCMVALAGCSTGDTGSTPTTEMGDDQTETGTDTMSDTTPSEEMGTESGTETDTGDDGDMDTGDDNSTTTGDGFNSLPGVSNGEVTNTSALVNASGDQVFDSPTDFELSGPATEGRFTFTLRNDSEQTLMVINETSTSSKLEYYITEDETYAKRNTTSGEISYGNNESSLSFETRIRFLIPVMYIDYLGLMEWETAGTTTVDGEEAYVFESSAINQTALQESDYNAPALENATAASGRLVVGPDGVMHDASIETESPEGGATMRYNLSTDASTDVTQPSWFDEAEAEASSQG